jgi:spermidine/putrescine transport system permease protein
VSAAIETGRAAGPVRGYFKMRGYFKNPWRKPRVLQGVTIGYLLWSLLPVVIAVIFSFNGGRSRISWQGFSLRWWTQDATDSLLHDAAMRSAMIQTYKLAIITVLVSVPLGTLFAIGIDRWHGRPARAANFTMLLSFVVPEIILGVSLYILFTNLFQGVVPLGTPAQVLGLISFQLSYPVIIVRARLLSIGPEYEEAAMDLGATPNQSIRRILLPLISPAILASVALVFADVVDDFVTVAALSGPASSETLAMKIYSASRASPTPEVNAAATMMLITTLLVVAGGMLFYRRVAKDHTDIATTDFMQL